MKGGKPNLTQRENEKFAKYIKSLSKKPVTNITS